MTDPIGPNSGSVNGPKRLVKFQVTDEADAALTALEDISGLSRAYLVRSMVEQHLQETGLLTPEARSEPSKPRGRKYR